MAPGIVCLLPVRNGADVLPGWLDEAGRFADAVIALDDGSTDTTGDVLRGHPLVAQVLVNRPRAGYLGWHDGVNRNRLLAAAAEMTPEWVVSVDIDERIDPSDAAALRAFVATEARPSCAYGFELYRMLGDETYDPDPELAFRLFRYRPGQRFLHHRLRTVPVPADIPGWVPTTLRIKHYGDVGPEGRAARLAKLREADPEGAFRDWYDSLPPLPTPPHPQWEPRDPSVSVIAAPAVDDLDLEGPVLTVAVLGDTGPAGAVERVLDAVSAADLAGPVQVMLVTEQPHGPGTTDSSVEAVHLPPGASRGARRNAALQAADGDYVVFVGPGDDITPETLRAVVEAHDRGHELVGGTPRHSGDSVVGRAAAVLDAEESEEDELASAGYSSFAVESLRRIGGFDEQSEVPEVIAAYRLRAAGFTGTRVPGWVVARSTPPSPAAFLRQRYDVGRAAAGAGVVRIGRAHVRRGMGASSLGVRLVSGAGAAATILGAARQRLARRLP